MTPWRAVLETLWRRPRIVRIEAAHSQRLPGGRTPVEVEVAGWGVLQVGRALVRPYWGGCVMRLTVPLGTPLRVAVVGVTGYDKREYRVEATLEKAPERAAVPIVNLDAIGSHLGTSLGREITARVPASFSMPTPLLVAIEPRLFLVTPLASQRPLLPSGPCSIEPVLVEVHMPPVRRERLSPPPSPTKLPLQDSH